VLEAVIFDFDGTIVDTETPEFESWREVFELHGFALDIDLWARAVGTINGWDPYEHLGVLLGREVDRDAVRAMRHASGAVEKRMVALLDGVEQMLIEARAMGMKVGIASSSPESWVCGHLERLAIEAHFDTVVCAGEGLPAKPDPAVYRTALERLGVESRRAIAIEDSPNGISAAQSAGLYCVAVPNPVTARLDLSGAHMVVASIADLSLREIAVVLSRTQSSATPL
jgi:HAD superfamily hydrolase (TIGR01509 family)